MRILLSIGQASNQQLLLDRLSTRYSVSVASPKNIGAAAADLLVLDGPTLARTRRQVIAWKAAARPVFAPVLLVAARQDVPQPAPAVWDAIDTFITAPVEPAELFARIDLLLRARADSLAQRQQLANLINYDQTTGLPSQVLLRERAAPSLAGAGRVALVVVSLDQLRLADGALGAGAVSVALRELAGRLVAALPPEATVGALARDELAVFLPDMRSPAAVADIAERLLAIVARPLAPQGRELALTARAGMALAPDDGEDFDTLLARARTALPAEPGAYRFVSDALHIQARERLLLLARLRRAVEREEFTLDYQPQIDLADNRVVGVEALVRWRPDGGSPVSPGAFIPLAEESGLIAPIGAQVLRMACRQCRSWRDAGLPLRVAVNLSTRQLAEDTLPDLVAETLAEAGVAPGDLELEVTESAAIDDPGATVARLHALASLGMCLAIDDFGAGYASLSYLARLPVDTLKLDQSFVFPLPADAASRAIVASTIALGHALGLRVIAEGVETAAQAAFLRETGCDEAQGYAINRPLPPEAVPQTVLRARQIE